jgi:hypothetical protein
MYDHPEYGEYTARILEEVLQDESDDRKAAIEFQARVVKPITDKFMPLFKRSGGEYGYVSIQGVLSLTTKLRTSSSKHSPTARSTLTSVARSP